VGGLYINDSVFFKGHVSPESIENFLTEKSSLVVSPSLHSDENSATQVLQGLLSVNRALLSDWGVHSDLKIYHPQLIDLMPITVSEFGPALSAHTIADALDKNLQRLGEPYSPQIDSYYQQAYFLNEQKNALSHNHIPIYLKFSDLANGIYEAKLDFTTSSTQIYSGYNDTNFIQMSQDYIGNLVPSEMHTGPFDAVPWMTFQDNIFSIDDPHKGIIKIKNELGNDNNFHIIFEKSVEIGVTKEIAERLFNNGFIN
jgi:hypothetical protein